MSFQCVSLTARARRQGFLVAREDFGHVDDCFANTSLNDCFVEALLVPCNSAARKYVLSSCVCKYVVRPVARRGALMMIEGPECQAEQADSGSFRHQQAVFSAFGNERQLAWKPTVVLCLRSAPVSGETMMLWFNVTHPSHTTRSNSRVHRERPVQEGQKQQRQQSAQGSTRRTRRNS